MSQQDDIRAAALLDAYLKATVRGEQPSAAAYLQRCPGGQVERLRAALEGLDFALQDYSYANVKEGTVQSTFQQIQERQRRRQALAAARARAQEADLVLSHDPALYLARILNVPTAALAMNPKPSATPQRGSGTWDRLAGRSSSQSRLQESKLQLQVVESEIERQAEQILERLGIATAPVDVHAVAEHFCLFAKEAPLDGLDGCLVIADDLGGIVVNRQQTTPQRQRFTLAHELGHYLRHRHLRVQFRDTLGEGGSLVYDQEEFEADTFAAMLLMPAFLLPDPFGSEPPSLAQADALARTFQVSLAAALRRIVRASHGRCALAVVKAGAIETWTRSPGLNGYVRKAQRPPAASVCAQLVRSEAAAEAAVILPASRWFGGPLAKEGVEVVEHSRREDSGYIYSLLMVIE